MLRVHNLIAGYGPLTVLNDVSLALPSGTRLGVFGHNGAGKTTLLRCIVGALRPRQGRVDVEGADTGTATVAENVRRGIAFVPQGHNVFPNLTVEQNRRIAGLLFDPAFVTQIFELFPVLAERRQQRAGSMSGGEQRMIALGVALMTKMATARRAFDGPGSSHRRQRHAAIGRYQCTNGHRPDRGRAERAGHAEGRGADVDSAVGKSRVSGLGCRIGQ
jgi:ABC-type sugar transport system ATPase subunit